jgi:hypothetical protein
LRLCVRLLAALLGPCSLICRLPADTITLHGQRKAGAAMEFSTFFYHLKSQIEKNWMLMNSTVIQNQLQQLVEVEKITEEEYEALMQFFDEQYHSHY